LVGPGGASAALDKVKRAREAEANGDHERSIEI